LWPLPTLISSRISVISSLHAGNLKPCNLHLHGLRQLRSSERLRDDSAAIAFSADTRI
jgi:hypothetical protein